MPHSLTAAGSVVYFAADDGTIGRELWRSDGQQVELVGDIKLGPSSGLPPQGAASEPMYHHRGVLYFHGFGEAGHGLWRSDGTVAGTFSIKASTAARRFIGIDESVFFIDVGCNGGEGLWQAHRDATAARCVLRLDPPASFFDEGFDSVAVARGTLFFNAHDPRTGIEPWAVPVAALFCRGDVNGDRRVTIDELIGGVAVALGTTDDATTHSLDSDGDGRVGISSSSPPSPRRPSGARHPEQSRHRWLRRSHAGGRRPQPRTQATAVRRGADHTSSGISGSTKSASMASDCCHPT